VIIKVLFKGGRDQPLFKAFKGIKLRKRAAFVNALVIVGYCSSQNLPFEKIDLDGVYNKSGLETEVDQAVSVTITLHDSRLIELVQKMPLSHRPEVIRRLVFLGLMNSDKAEAEDVINNKEETNIAEVVASSYQEPSSSHDMFA